MPPPIRSLAAPRSFPLLLRTHPRVRTPLFRSRPRRQPYTDSAADRPVHVRKNLNPLRTYRGPLLVAQFVAAYIIWARLSAWMLPDDLEDDDEADAGDVGAVINEDGTIDPADQIFVPLWWPKPLPVQPFKATDPTWQEFTKFSKDKDRQQAVRDEICSQILSTYGPPFSKALGGEVKIGRTWLDTLYPDGPPPDYVRPGISFFDQGIALSEQTMPHTDYVRMRHLAYPSAFLSAFKAGAGYYSSMKIIKIKHALGMGLTQQDRRYIMVRAQAEHQLLQLGAVERAQDAINRRKQIDQDSDKGMGPLSGTGHSTPPSANGSAAGAGSADGEARDWWSISLPIIKPPMTLDCFCAVQVGVQTWRKAWRDSRTDLTPPGAVHFEGMVELLGTQRKAKCMIHAAYDPKECKVIYVAPPKPIRINDRVQRAKGGPGGPAAPTGPFAL